jgi:hypothetical protein
MQNVYLDVKDKSDSQSANCSFEKNRETSLRQVTRSQTLTVYFLINKKCQQTDNLEDDCVTSSKGDGIFIDHA